MSISFEKILDSGQNRQNTEAIIAAIKVKPSRINELMELFFSKNLRHCQRASWPIGFIGEKFPHLIEPFYQRMLDNLEHPLHDAVIRNSLRTWQFVDIPEEFEGQIFDLCVNYLTDLNRPTGIRMFAMVICSNLAMKYPELKEEIIPIIEDYAPHGTVGLKSRGRRELIRLKKD